MSHFFNYLFPFLYNSVPDPDLDIRGGGWGGVQKFFFWPFGPQFGLKIRVGTKGGGGGGGGHPDPSTGSGTVI